MGSSINIAIPPLGAPTTAGVRTNFSAAKSEIESLQQQIGYADYNDLITNAMPIAVPSNTWMKVTNDTLGAQTRVRLPIDVTKVWDPATNRLTFTELPVDTMLNLRVDLNVTTSSANQIVRLRANMAIGGTSPFTLETNESLFRSSGAHKVFREIPFYIGSEDMRTHPGEFEIFSDSPITVRVQGWYLSVVKFLGI